jgi:prefoldin beta subunit
MDPSVANKLQRDLQNEVSLIQEIMKKSSNLISQRAKLAAQQQENQMVKKELDSLKNQKNNEEEENDENSDVGQVYKLIGPVLIKQDLSESVSNVNNRLKYLSTEIERLDKQQKDYENQRIKHQNNINNIQENAKRLQQEAVQKAAKK